MKQKAVSTAAATVLLLGIGSCAGPRSTGSTAAVIESSSSQVIRTSDSFVTLGSRTTIWSMHAVDRDTAILPVRSAADFIKETPLVVLGSIADIRDGTSGGEEQITELGLASTLIVIKPQSVASETVVPDEISIELTRSSKVSLDEVRQSWPRDEVFAFMVKPLDEELKSLWSSSLMCANYAYCILEMATAEAARDEPAIQPALLAGELPIQQYVDFSEFKSLQDVIRAAE